MTITYKDTKDFKAQELQDLFLSVHWASGYHPEKLVIAMKNSGAVYSAWDGEKLVGLANVLDDGIMTAYVHYVLVDPDYQCSGIGKELMNRINKQYETYLRILLVASDNNIGFYENCDYKTNKKGIPMQITSLLN